MELNYTKQLADKKGVSQNEVFLYEAKLAKAQAKVDLAQAELDFATVKAPFDGIVDRLHTQKGSLVKEGDMLTTLSDNSVMWVYFNVTERRYLEYMGERRLNEGGLDVELMLADHNKYPHLGKIDLAQKIGAIEANFNNETGNIAFRADFPNPDRLLRHGQTGTVLIRKTLKNAIVIPQRSTFENLAKRYVYVVDKDDVVHQREVVIDQEQEDIFVVGSGLEHERQDRLRGDPVGPGRLEGGVRVRRPEAADGEPEEQGGVGDGGGRRAGSAGWLSRRGAARGALRGRPLRTAPADASRPAAVPTPQAPLPDSDTKQDIPRPCSRKSSSGRRWRS